MRAGSQPVEPDDVSLQQPNSSPKSTAGTPRVQSDQDASLRDLPDLVVDSADGAVVTWKLVAFVQALRKAVIEEDVLTLPAHILTRRENAPTPPEDVWIGGAKELQFLRGKVLIRRCYVDLRNLLIDTSEEQLSRRRCSKNFLVIGNPGIGKSLFSYYMVRELMKLKKTVVWQPSDESNQVLRITSTTISFAEHVKAFADDLENGSTWYVVDGQPPVRCTAITLLVTSPARHTWKRFAKRSAVTRYMPTWSKAEIDMVKTRRMAFDELDSAELTQSEIDERFRKWGGIPRFVFQYARDEIEQASLECAVNSVNIEELGKFVGEADEFDARHKVMHMKVKIEGPEDGWYMSYVMDFASQHVREKLRKRLVVYSHEQVKELIWAVTDHPMAAAFRRMLSDCYVHSFLLSGAQFQVRKLDGNASADNELFDVDFGRLRMNEFANLEDVVATEDTYYKPTRKTLMSVDSLLFPNKLFRMAVSAQHVMNTAGIEEVGDHMVSAQTGRRAQNFELYFIVPSDRFYEFQRQQYTSEEPAFKTGVSVHQYVLQADLPSTCFRGMETLSHKSSQWGIHGVMIAGLHCLLLCCLIV